MILEFLPGLQECCFSIPLKVGCIIISILGILSSSSVGLMYGSYAGSSLQSILEIFSYASSAVQIIFSLASLFLLIMLLLDNAEMACMVWLFVCLAYVVIMVVYAILSCPLFYGSGYSASVQGWSSTLTFLITPAFWIYCMCVVNSYDG